SRRRRACPEWYSGRARPFEMVKVSSRDRRMATDRFGIDDSYHDARGVAHETSRATRAALQAAMGVEPESAAPAPDDPGAVRVLLPGGDRTLTEAADLVLEDG